MTIKIQRKPVKVGVKQINDVYGLQHVDMGEFITKGCTLGRLLVRWLWLEKKSLGERVKETSP